MTNFNYLSYMMYLYIYGKSGKTNTQADMMRTKQDIKGEKVNMNWMNVNVSLNATFPISLLVFLMETLYYDRYMFTFAFQVA